MGKTLYIDCFSGIAGDMLVGALLDLGLPIDGLRAALGSLAIACGEVSADRVVRAGVSATKFRVHAAAPVASGHAAGGHRHHHDHDDHHGGAGGHAHHHHSLAQITAAIEGSGLSSRGKARAVGLFARLAEAEAAIHAVPVDRVHLHEVGAVDSIVDIVGAVHGMEWLGAETIVASPVNVGGGTVECAHGTFPVPAPATARLLHGVPIYAGPLATELTTPTGALLVTEYATGYGPLPLMRVAQAGYGAGDKDFPKHPNVLRLLVGEPETPVDVESILTLECEIDDMNPQIFGPLMDRLYAAGALEVFYAPVQMKKNRPGTLVTVIAAPERRSDVTGVLFAETTTIGVRYREMLRERLARHIAALETPLGAIRYKVATRGDQVMNAAPEFEDCARIAREQGRALKDVQAIAIKAWLDARGRD